ncbi:Gfo/Idh/MocA family protein [Conservatibacter flavescens]|uniref:Gfo/Idh/MocA family oxidoreductase n=1 Tax=Conservatibacter flavescens TaxID=28161 RepID=A0A2M8S451_9PAST|nr:Gfo/Idh/MocA family oxidoreductase [Conservatibacter flavescens]PJG85924.1 gfo/Idh/MocA family oxidoreductase [Conservatibacter flavescens]
MKIGIVGSGKIVYTCLNALSQIPNISINGICVRPTSLSKGEELSRDYNIERVYTDYNQFLQDPNIEQIYIALPNHLHATYTEQALLAGKDVICEKPFTVNYAQLQKLVNLAKQQNRFLFEAITSIHTPMFAQLRTELAHIGDIKILQANYSQFSSRYNDYLQGNIHYAFDPHAAGGALYDINLYNVYNVCALFGRPEQVYYHYSKGHNGIDTSGVLCLHYPTFIAVCIGAKDTNSESHFTIQGTFGTLKIADAPNECRTLVLTRDGQCQTWSNHGQNNRMVYEFEVFQEIIEQQDYTRCHQLLDLALTVADTLERARIQAGISFPHD